VDQLFCMRVFARVVEQGSFVRAAEALSVSKPTVTTAVAQLERRLGVRLLHRTTRRLSLSDEGRSFYARCTRILDDVAEAEESLSEARLSPRGRLRVSVPLSFADQWFFPALPRLLDKYPDLSLDVLMTDRAVNLVEEGIDCAARGVGIPDDSTLVARHISRSRWVTCASPAYLAKHGMPRTVEELEQHNCVRFISPSTGRTIDWVFEESGVRRQFTPRGTLGVSSPGAVISAAVAGLGIAQVPDPVAFRNIMAGELVLVLFDRLAAAPEFVVVYPSARYLTAKVRAFADFIADVYSSDRWWPDIERMARATAAAAPPPRRRRAPGSG